MSCLELSCPAGQFQHPAVDRGRGGPGCAMWITGCRQRCGDRVGEKSGPEGPATCQALTSTGRQAL